MLYRVESISEKGEFDADFSDLRSGIKKLQKASTALDEEKVDAEKELRKIIRKLRKPYHKHGGLFCKLPKALRKFLKNHGIGKHKKCQCSKHSSEDNGDIHIHKNERQLKPRVGRYPAWRKEQLEKELGNEEHVNLLTPPGNRKPHPPIHAKPELIKKLIKAAKRVRKVNQKLVTFERGFISEEGIKDREWYRHLGVAPGKWLGEF